MVLFGSLLVIAVVSALSEWYDAFVHDRSSVLYLYESGPGELYFTVGPLVKVVVPLLRTDSVCAACW